MRVVSVNLGFHGSTGNIMKNIQSVALDNGFDYIIAAPFSKGRDSAKDNGRFYIGTEKGKKLSNYASILSGLDGCFSVFATRKFLKRLSSFSPDIIHLHNIHYSYVNLPMLFKYIKKNNVKVVWTLHDCWAFTGHCPHFDLEGCNKWQTGCKGCRLYKNYPKSIYDNSSFMWKLKRKWFTGVNNMTIVTPSKWLGNLVESSYLNNYPVKTIYNGIDLSVFKPVEGDFRKRYSIPDNKKILLGVAYSWGYRKGLDVFSDFAQRLDPTKYQIVLVGTNDSIDKQLPENIISIHKTDSQNELAEIYTAADLFVNPTREDVLGMVNIEALACGTPVLTFQTGGCAECLDGTSGRWVLRDDVDSLASEIEKICGEDLFKKEDCVKRAKEFDANTKFKEYIELYKSL